MSRMSEYCKAYPVERLRAFPGWTGNDERSALADDHVLFLHDNYHVTDGIFVDEQVIFDADTPEWRRFCHESLGFEIPDDVRDADAVRDANAPASA